VDSKDISNGILRLGETGFLKFFDRRPLLKTNGVRAKIRTAMVTLSDTSNLAAQSQFQS
jgi:hypothetical protein